ncbi:MAG: hypothetical protein ACJ786_38165 [Catenulispora sp.]
MPLPNGVVVFRRRRRLSLAVVPLVGVVLAADPGARVPAAVAAAAATHVIVTPPASRQVARNSGGCVEAFVRNPADGAVWHIGQNQPGSDWGPWSPLGGSAAADPVVATGADGRLEVFATGADGSVSSLVPSANPGACGLSWAGAGWTSRGGGITGAPAAATGLDGRILVLGVGKDGHLHATRQTVAGSVYGETWSPWSDLSTPAGVTLAGVPAVAMSGDGRLQVFARGPPTALRSDTRPAAPAPGSSGGSASPEPLPGR